MSISVNAPFGLETDRAPARSLASVRVTGGTNVAGYSQSRSDSVTFDLAYTYVYLRDRNQTASTGKDAVGNGRYKSRAHIVMASLQYVFEK